MCERSHLPEFRALRNAGYEFFTVRVCLEGKSGGTGSLGL